MKKIYEEDAREYAVYYRIRDNKAIAGPFENGISATFDVAMFRGTKPEALGLLKKMKPKFFNKETYYEKREEGKAQQA